MHSKSHQDHLVSIHRVLKYLRCIKDYCVIIDFQMSLKDLMILTRFLF